MITDLPPIDSWVAHLAAELGVAKDAVDLRAILDMARDVAHHVDRPAAPVSAFLAGLAAAQSGGTPAATRAACARAAELARVWTKEDA